MQYQPHPLRLHLHAVLGKRLVRLQVNRRDMARRYRRNAENTKLNSVAPTHSSVDCKYKVTKSELQDPCAGLCSVEGRSRCAT